MVKASMVDEGDVFCDWQHAVMTELAYMTRSDWGQDGTAMVPQSAVIREWIGGPPYLFAVTNIKDFSSGGKDADFDAANYIAPDPSARHAVNITQLGALSRNAPTTELAVVVLHPFEDRDLEALASAVSHGSFKRLFILIWSGHDVVHTWLDGLGALNLHSGQRIDSPDELTLAAAAMMVKEEYNGLSSGNGKDAVVQLVRAFAAEGYPVDDDAWVRAYFAAGGSFRHAASVAKLVKEMKAGTRHRVRDRYVANIVEVLRHRVEGTGAS